MAPAILIDDADPKLKYQYSGDQWSLQPGSGEALFNRTLTGCDLSKKSYYTSPSLSLSFYGSDFAIYGPGLTNAAINYTIDGTTLRPATDFNGSAPANLKTGVKLFSLPGLDTRYHTVSILPSSGFFAYDYMVYTPSRSSTLTGAQIIVDDADSLLQYSANDNWAKLANQTFSNGMPYQMTLSSSTAKGSTIKMDFTGASISVYGAMNQQSGTLSAQFAVDGGTPTTYTIFNGAQTVDPSSWRLNERFFYKDLVPGKHSLQVTLSDISGSQALYIDSVVFEGTSATTLASTSSSSTSSTNDAATNALKSWFSPTRIGGIIAAIVVIGILGCALRIWRRRRRFSPYVPPRIPRTPQSPSQLPFRRQPSTWSSSPPSQPETPFMTMPSPMMHARTRSFDPPPGPPPGDGSSGPAINALVGLLNRRSTPPPEPMAMPTPTVIPHRNRSPTPPPMPSNPMHNMDGSDDPPAARTTTTGPATQMREVGSGDHGGENGPPPYRERHSTETLD